MQQLRARWAALAPRERQLVAVAVGLVALGIVWWVALAPALRVLRAAPAEHARLDTQLQQMNALAQQAKALQSQARPNSADATRALETAVQDQLGAGAQMQSQGAGDGVRVSMKGVSAEALARWLAQARNNARALPREAHLTRAADSSGAVARPAPSAARPASGAIGGSLLGRGGAPFVAGSPTAPSTRNEADSNGARWDGNIVLGLPAER
ncbi:type II secretion system protein GspM [Variovorax dokdonensis]|uniref:Type II secretion system protein GspM n=1 Tax=Variovorax dokdonensis TaxID=344883 RepID=A0ABT7NBT6_9BURK|nr:type II secretion system protein GspM [Variovorax dokdonensis]MDM0045335.1 type II secretion system protein GspM [Variovorax dokdonensis]